MSCNIYLLNTYSYIMRIEIYKFHVPTNIYIHIAAMHQIQLNNIALIHQILAFICTSVGIKV